MAIQGTGSNPTHHIVLTDGTDSIGFVITDNAGKRNERTFRRFPRPDLADPYTQETQSSWELGFGNAKFENNRSAYWRSQGLDLTKAGAITLGPHFVYGEGYRSAHDYLRPHTGLIRYSLSGSGRYRAEKFTTVTGFSAVCIKFWGCVIGKGKYLTVELRSDSAGAPGTVLRTQTLTAGVGSDMQVQKVSITSYALASATSYWIVFKAQSTDDANNCWLIGGEAIAGGASSADGTTWVIGHGYFIRVTDADKPAIARFYDYKGQLYTAFDYDDKSASKIYMNGWRGACDDNSANKLRLYDATQTGWATADLPGCVARVVAGPATSELDDWREISDRGSGYLVCDTTWNVTHSINDDYVVLGSNLWFEIPKSASFTGRITDIAVANGIAYFCRSNDSELWLHQEYNANGTWTADTSSLCWIKTLTRAGFARVQNDPLSGDTIWFGRNVGIFGKYRPEVWQALAPKAWDNENVPALNTVMINDLETAWTAGATTVEVLFNPKPDCEMTFVVKIGMVTAVNTVPTAGGTGYTLNDILTINQTGSGLNCKVKVTGVSGGVVTAIALEAAYKGWDYTVGTGKPTTGGTGTGCTVEITTIASFNTGTVAYYYVNNSPIDLRFINRLRYTIMASAFMASGDLSFALDDSAGLATPYVTIPIPTLVPLKWYARADFFDIGDIADAKSTLTVGLILNTAQTKTFSVHLNDFIEGLDFQFPIDVGDDGDNITGLELYGDPSTLWVFTDGGMGEIRNNMWNPVELRELRVARHPSNGRAHDVNDVYLYFSWRGRMQRFYRQTMEDLGPDFPNEFAKIRGQVSAIQTYAGRLYVAIDGGASRRSQILVYKGHAWHEVYTSCTGERIRSLHIQAIPGKSDRLWAGVGGDLIYFPIELDAVTLSLDTDFKYRGEGWLETSWIYTSRQDLVKLFREVELFADYLSSEDGQSVEVSYKLDTEDAAWNVVDVINEGPHAILEIDPSFPPSNIRGHRIRLRLRLRSSLNTSTPVVTQFTLSAYRIPRVKYSYSFLTKLSRIAVDLRGDESKILGQYATVGEAYEILNRWAKDLMPLHVKETSIVELAGMVVTLEPLPANLFRLIPEEGIQEDLIQVTLNEF